jgi:hypothetical protein
MTLSTTERVKRGRVRKKNFRLVRQERTDDLIKAEQDQDYVETPCALHDS